MSYISRDYFPEDYYWYFFVPKKNLNKEKYLNQRNDKSKNYFEYIKEQAMYRNESLKKQINKGNKINPDVIRELRLKNLNQMKLFIELNKISNESKKIKLNFI